MTTEDIIIHIFYLVTTSLPDFLRHSQAKLYPSGLVTNGILFSLRGGFFRAFYFWLKQDYGNWFGNGTLPERTRLQRLLKTHRRKMYRSIWFFENMRKIVTMQRINLIK